MSNPVELEVTEALAAVTSSAPSQLRLLTALSALSSSLPEGFLHGLVEQFALERQQAFVSFHERRLASVDVDDDARAEAAAFALGAFGDAAAIAPPIAATTTTTATPTTATPTTQPFFARFLERQQR